MNQLKLYLEFRFGKRKPQLEFSINYKKFIPTTIWQEKNGEYQINEICEYSCVLAMNNLLTITQLDKTDNDMLRVGEQWVDHYAQVREIEVDGIKFETALFSSSKFKHSMPQSWVDRMSVEGHNILSVYENCTEIRLNGTYQCSFNLPVWQWLVNKL